MAKAFHLWGVCLAAVWPTLAGAWLLFGYEVGSARHLSTVLLLMLLLLLLLLLLGCNLQHDKQ